MRRGSGIQTDQGKILDNCYYVTSTLGTFCSEGHVITPSNLFKVQKGLKRDSRFKIFAIEYIQDIVKDEMSTVISNPKLSISSSKISPDAIEGFFMLTIDNKHARSALILQSILTVSTSSIGISSHSFY